MCLVSALSKGGQPLCVKFFMAIVHASLPLYWLLENELVAHVLRLLLHLLLHPSIHAAGRLRLLLRLPLPRLPPGEQYEVLVLHVAAAHGAPAEQSSLLSQHAAFGYLLKPGGFSSIHTDAGV